MNKSALRTSSAFLVALFFGLLLVVCAFAPQQAHAAEPNYDLYKKVLQDEYKRTIGVRAGMCEYSVFDIDGDGISELIVWSWYQGNEGASWVSIYTISGSKAYKIDEQLSAASFLSFFSKGSTLFYTFDPRGTNDLAGRVTKNGNSISYSNSYRGSYVNGYIKSNNASELKRAQYNDHSLLPGWKKDSRGWWYRYANGGYPANKWEIIAGKWYYFDKSGYMHTGWKQISGKWYFLDRSSGAMATGWRWIDGSCYYFGKSSGAMAWGEWREGYWLNEDGSWTYKYKGSWHQNSKGWWFGDESGWYAKNGYQWIDGKRYYFNSSGYWVEKKAISV